VLTRFFLCLISGVVDMAESAVQLHVTFVLNTNPAKRSAMIWKTTIPSAAGPGLSGEGADAATAANAARAKASRAQYVELIKAAKNKLGLRKKPQRLFVQRSGVELGLESVSSVIRDASQAASKEGLVLVVSLGEDLMGAAPGTKTTTVAPSKPASSAASSASPFPSVITSFGVTLPTLDRRGVWVDAQRVLLTCALTELLPSFSPGLVTLIAAYATEPAPSPVTSTGERTDSKGSVSAQNKARKAIDKTLKDTRSAKLADVRIHKVRFTSVVRLVAGNLTPNLSVCAGLRVVRSVAGAMQFRAACTAAGPAPH
jgi:hypothetical protein